MLQVIRVCLNKLSALLSHGHVAPLQYMAYSFADVLPAFRHFSSAQHIGQIVTHMPFPAGKGGSEEDRVAGRWVIGGGLGSLGMLTADWLVGQGQAHLVLLGRSGR